MWPNSKDAISSVHLVENSPMMRSRQAQKLSTWRGSHHIPVHWWDSIEDIPAASGKLAHWLKTVHADHPFALFRRRIYYGCCT